MMPSKMLSQFLALIAIFASCVGCTKKEMRQASSSMEPTIKRGEVLSVDLTAYSGSGPVRWDVVVFESPVAGGGHWASRVVGLPGESIDIRSGKVVINGKEETLPPSLSIGGYQLSPRDTNTPDQGVKLPACNGNRFWHPVSALVPCVRFPEEPGAGNPHAGICEGGTG